MSGNVVESCVVISRPVRGEFLIMRLKSISGLRGIEWVE